MTISKAFYYKSGIPPKLVHSLVVTSNEGAAATKYNIQRRRIEIWTTNCIVTNFGKTTNANCSILINPSNAELSGVSNFTYFPRGGPVPDNKISSSMHRDWQPLGYVSNWGGMEVGSGMLYPVSVVDGLVHQLGGWKLAAACRWRQSLRSMQHPGRQSAAQHACPIGMAVCTTHACSELLEQYNAIIHTTPPFYLHDENPIQQLDSCYQSALTLAATIPAGKNKKNNENIAELRVASPLLGAGARGFPMDVAIQVAAKASWRWLQDENNDDDENEDFDKTRRITLAFGLLEPSWANDLMEAFMWLQEPNYGAQ